MTKIRILVFGLIAIFFAGTSCSKENSTGESENAVKQENLLLKEAYGFENITQNVNKSNVKAFKAYNQKRLTSKSNVLEELDLTRITQIDWNSAKTSYLIPFANNPKKTIIILVDNSTDIENIDFSKGTIVEYNLDHTTGNGDIIITTDVGTQKKSFADGVLIESQTSKKTFRQCFDDAYNDICDGAIGCASWYSSPLPALTAVAYCAATTYEQVYPDEPLPTLPLDDEPMPTFPPDEQPLPTLPTHEEPLPTSPTFPSDNSGQPVPVLPTLPPADVDDVPLRPLTP